MSERAKKVLFENMNSLKGTNNNMFAPDDEHQDGAEREKSSRPEKQKKIRVFADLESSLVLEIDEIIFVETRKAREKNIMNDVKKAALIRELIRKGIGAYWKENPRDTN